jgi:hypothetical protein
MGKKSHQFKMQGPGDPNILCCCEYINESGEKSHLCGLLCDCAEVDDAFDRLIRGEKWHQKQLKNICSTIHDRFVNSRKVLIETL